jgi:hypothetical protein
MENKKKIGILTFHYSRYNFGAVLQTFSIYKLVESLGYQSQVINYQPENKSIKAVVWTKIMAILGHRFDVFRTKYILGILPKTQTAPELASLNKSLDGFVVGSDQVWRYIYDSDTLYKYYLNFVNDDKVKIAYAASFGVDYWPSDKSEVTNQVKQLMSRFDSISVREESGVDLCRDVFEQKAITVLDPTLMVDKKLFYKIANPKTLEKNKFLAYMMLHNHKETEVYFKKVCKNEKLKFVRLQGKKIFTKKMMFYFNSVNDWLSYIRDAEIVVTDSFHCVCFSIIFRKNFIVISNPITGITRLKNLLILLNEDFRFYDSIDSVPDHILKNVPNYANIDSVLNTKREQSLTFLREALTRVQ